jgi:hypothetical protein
VPQVELGARESLVKKVHHHWSNHSEQETPSKRPVDRILEETSWSNKTILDTLVEITLRSLTRPLTKRILLRSIQVRALRVNDPADNSIVDRDADEVAPELGQEGGSWADLHVVTNLLILQDTLSAVPALTSDDTIHKGADWMCSGCHVSVTRSP